jgi:hypothetical protein
MSSVESQIEEKYQEDFKNDKSKTFWNNLFQIFRSKTCMKSANLQFHELFTPESMSYESDSRLFLLKESDEEV